MIELLLLGLLTFAPFAYGGVEEWAELVVVALAMMLGTCVAMRLLLFPDLPLIRTWAFLPLVLFLALVTIQLLPLPAGLISIFSPNTVRTRTHLLSDLPDAANTLKSFPISLYPYATRHDFRLVISASSLFFAVSQYYRKPEQIKRLLVSIAMIGSAVGLLAFAQDLSGSERIYFVGPPGRGRASAGPFIHYSHFSQFMNLCIGVMLSLLLVVLYRKFRRGGFKASELYLRWRDASFRPAWLLAIAISMGVTTIFMSGSRGGMLATLIAFALLTFSLSKIKSLPGQGWLIVPIALMVFGVASFFGFDAAINRLDTLLHHDQTGGRMQILKDLTREWKQYPLIGTGLGTHEVVYPQYDRSTELALATHAEDEYAQVIEESGFVGLFLVLCFATIIWVNFVKALRHGDISSQLIVAGLGFGLIAVNVHSLTDFGQHMPAVACLSAVICGLIICVARVPALEMHSDKVSSVDEANIPPPAVSVPQPAISGVYWIPNWVSRSSIAISITAVGLWAVRGAGASFAAAGEWNIADTQYKKLADENLKAYPEECVNLLAHSALAIRLDPDNVQHRCFSNVYRWEIIARPVDGKSMITPAIREECQRILADLRTAMQQCPVYGPDYFFAAQIEDQVFSDSIAEHDALAAYELSQTNGSACLLAAEFDTRRGRWNESKIKFQRYLALGGSFDAVTNEYVKADRPELALELAQNDIKRLESLAVTMGNNPKYSKLTTKINARAFDLMSQQCSRSEASPDLLVEYADESIKRKDLPTAIESYRRAIAQDYGQVDWHLALAGALAQTEQVPEAMHEAEICLRLRPKMAAAEKMIGDLSLRPNGRDQ